MAEEQRQKVEDLRLERHSLTVAGKYVSPQVELALAELEQHGAKQASLAAACQAGEFSPLNLKKKSAGSEGRLQAALSRLLQAPTTMPDAEDIMQNPDDPSVRRRPDGSIDIEHYVAVAHRARMEEARLLRSAIRSAIRPSRLRLGQSRPAMETAASAAGMQAD